MINFSPYLISSNNVLTCISHVTSLLALLGFTTYMTVNPGGESGSGDSIVREMGRVGETVAAGAIFQHGFLVADGIGLGCGQSFRC